MLGFIVPSTAQYLVGFHVDQRRFSRTFLDVGRADSSTSFYRPNAQQALGDALAVDATRDAPCCCRHCPTRLGRQRHYQGRVRWGDRLPGIPPKLVETLARISEAVKVAGGSRRELQGSVAWQFCWRRRRVQPARPAGRGLCA